MSLVSVRGGEILHCPAFMSAGVRRRESRADSNMADFNIVAGFSFPDGDARL
jgi:hypothetical protein